MDEFNADFYSTAAQVIPVFLFVAFGSLLGLDRFVREEALPGVALAVIGVTAVMVYAEIACLSALNDQEAPTRVEESLIDFALFGAPGFVMSAVVVANWPHARSLVPDLRGFGVLGFVVGVIVLSVVSTVCDIDPAPILGAVVLAIGYGAFFWGGWNVVRLPRKDEDERKDDEDEDEVSRSAEADEPSSPAPPEDGERGTQ